MNTITKIVIALFLAEFFASCKKEIQLDLQNKESQLVIEADFDSERKVNTVYLSQTIEIRETNKFPTLSNAQVIVTDNHEYYEILKETKPGVYQTSSFAGVIGRTYSLKVILNGKMYVAESTLPAVVKLDTAFAASSQFGKSRMVGFLPVYTDPAGVKNYYRFVQFVNGDRVKGSILTDDTYSDGLQQNQTLSSMNLEAKPGDTLHVEMQMIDEANYTYFTSKEKTVNLDAAAPANPVSNIKGGALGFFNVHSTQTAKMIIQG
jgi:hypothetical protein